MIDITHNLGDWLGFIIDVRQMIVMKSQTVLPHLLHIGRVLIPLEKDHIAVVF
jgi:hypothetical protein